MDKETLYFHLRQLVETAPVLASPQMVTPDARRWLGRASALVEQVLGRVDAISFNVACDGIGGPTHFVNVNTVMSMVHRALAKAELSAPAAAQGQFLAAGDAFSAMAAITKVFTRAREWLLVVDKYAEVTLLTDFAVTAPQSATFRILAAEGEARRAELAPAIRRWTQQFGSTRSLDLRLAPGQQLHDRMIIIDGLECWAVGQSFNALATRSPTYVTKLDSELAEQKIAAYTAAWASAAPVTPA